MDNGNTPEQDLAETESKLREAIREANQRLKVELKEELLEAMHEIETHLLKGFWLYRKPLEASESVGPGRRLGPRTAGSP